MKRVSKVLTFICAILCSLTASAAGRPAFGVGTHVIGLSRDVQWKQLDLVQSASFDSVRADVPWKFAEQSLGVFSIPAAWDRLVDEAVARGIHPILILDYGNPLYDGGDKPRSKEAVEGFARYAAYIVEHFRGRVRVYEIWNEWDNHTGGFPAASPEDYARLFKRVYPELKKLDPDSTFLVSSGVQQGWYQRLAELGVVTLGDGVSVHPYNYQKPLPNAPELVAKGLIELEAELKRTSGKNEVPIFVTEIGWPTNVGRFGHEESEVSSFAFRTSTLLASLPFVRGMWWYELLDGGDDAFNKENRFGLIRRDGTKKPAYDAIVASRQMLKGSEAQLESRSRLDEGLVFVHLSGSASTLAVEWMAGLLPEKLEIECKNHLGQQVARKTFAFARIMELAKFNGDVCS